MLRCMPVAVSFDTADAKLPSLEREACIGRDSNGKILSAVMLRVGLLCTGLGPSGDTASVDLVNKESRSCACGLGTLLGRMKAPTVECAVDASYDVGVGLRRICGLKSFRCSRGSEGTASVAPPRRVSGVCDLSWVGLARIVIGLGQCI